MSDESLTTAGQARSDAILAESIALGRSLARRRRRRRAALAVGVPLAVAVATIALTLPRPRTELTQRKESQSPAVSRERATQVATAPAPRITVAIIPRDPTITRRYATRPIPSNIKRISDDELLTSLSSEGLRGGLATIGDKTRLLLDAR